MSTSANIGELVQLIPLQSPQPTEHCNPCFRQLQRFESQLLLQLHRIILSRFSGAVEDLFW